MKKIISSLFILSVGLFLFPSAAFCQDTTKVRYENNEDADDQNTMTGQQDTTAMLVPVRKTALGLEVGFNASYLTIGENTSHQNTGDPVYGARAGMVLDIPLVGGLYLQPGFFYAMNGGNIAGEGTWDINTIEVPVNLTYKFNLSHANFFFIGAGPYVGYNLSGTGTGRDLGIGTDPSNDDIRAWDWGVGANLGFELNSGLFFRARYQQGFYNMQPGGQFAAINSASYGVQIGYFFGRNERVVPVVPASQHPELQVWD